MLRLNNEILFKIFDYLTVFDKRICVRVCKHWQFLIEGYNFYEDLNIYGSAELLIFNKYFQQDKSRRNQVHRLQISLFGKASHVNDILALPEQFRHLREFVYRHDEGDTDESDISEIVIDKRVAQHWQGISKFYNYDKYFVSSELLQYGGFRNLVELGVRFGGRERSEIKCDALIQHLSNAPKLKKLNLDHGIMSLSHLHQLHYNAQQLEVLCFYDMDLVSRDVNEQGRLVASSNTLTELRLFRCTKPYTESMLDRTEYSKLKILKVCISSVHDEKYGEDQLIKLVSSCHYLENYDVNIHPITPAIMEAMDASGIQLKELTIKALPNENFLRQLESLQASNQKSSVLKMTLNFANYYENKDLEVNKLFDLIKGVSKVKRLEIVAKNYYLFPSFPLYEFLSKVRNLEILELKYWEIRLNANLFKLLAFKLCGKFKTKLKSLVLDQVTCCDKSMWFISETCPELSRLTISPKYSSLFPTLNFPNHSFASITVDTSSEWVYYNTGCYYQVVDENGTKWYKIVGGIQEEVSRVLPKSEDIRILLLKYKSCTTLKLGYAYVQAHTF
ncbi:hypothetical protein [Parasitella parasitica]|uniref:F-box domain-containing protein n=1 Tax=Parasitella parasitica TaxID=35722 RepID=A0A0B7MYD4_9FUNG|nr:hypothetical protein [Parasitella parasitica]